VTAPAGFASHHAAAALVYVPDVDVDGAAIVIDGEDGHHLQRVRRLAVGEAVVAADGRGRWVPCTVTHAAGGTLHLAAADAPRAEPRLAPGLAVAFAPAKGDHAVDVVHALVELGADRIIPIESERSVVRWHDDRAQRAVTRLRRVAREAAMLARRAWLPTVEEPVALASLASHPAPVVGDVDGGPVAALASPRGGEWLVITGPEGGFAPAELDRFASAARVAVGSHVLRARTAPVALAAAVAGCRRPQEGP
jgi:16S rRNA (uracil1498-N3)-methyltransferase